MKIITLALSVICLFGTAQAQQDTLPPYLKSKTVPAFRLLLSDSSTQFTQRNLEAGKPVMFMLFNPDCEHCQLQTRSITSRIKELGDLQIIMTTYRPIDKIRSFRQVFQLDQYPSIVTGRDSDYFFAPFFRVKSIPFLAIYGRDRRLISVYEGNGNVERIKEALKKAGQ